MRFKELFGDRGNLINLNKKSIYLFIILIVLFSALTLMLNSFKLLHPLIVVLSVLFSYFVIFLLYILQKHPKDLLNSLDLLLFLILFFSICLSIYMFIPSDPKGINTEHLEVKFNFYVVNNEISKNELLDYVKEANKIWNKYNISIVINNVEFVEINISDEKRTFLYTGISEKNTTEQNEKICKEEYMPIINSITNNNPNMSIIFIEGKGNSGRGNLCGHSFAIFQYEKLSLFGTTVRDLTGWNLAHEIGHIFGLSDLKENYKINLMNDKHKLFYKSDYLSQDQIERIIKDKSKNKVS